MHEFYSHTPSPKIRNSESVTVLSNSHFHVFSLTWEKFYTIFPITVFLFNIRNYCVSKTCDVLLILQLKQWLCKCWLCKFCLECFLSVFFSWRMISLQCWLVSAVQHHKSVITLSLSPYIYMYVCIYICISPPFLSNFIFFKFWLYWVFITAWEFSLVATSEGTLSSRVWRLSSCKPTGLVARRHLEYSWTRDWPVSPAIQRGFLTTGPPGKP